MATQQIREIKIKIDTGNSSGDLKSIADGMGKMNQSVQRGTTVLEKFGTAYRSILGLSIAGFGIKSLVETVDSMQQLNNKLNLTEGSAEKAAETLGKFTEIARITKSGISDISVVYTRLTQAMSDLGVGTDAVLGVTLALQNSFRISGSTAAEARGATIQLSQALASGQLRGQELRSVLESNALVSELLAKKLGIARGELIKWSENNGGIKTSVVLGALADDFDRINTMAQKLTPTIGESLTMAFDKVKLKLGELNQESGASKKIGEVILLVADNLNTLIKVAGTALGIWASFKAGLIVSTGLTYAYNLALGIQSAVMATSLIGVEAMTAGLYAQATASGVALAALGPIGIAIALAGTAYVLLNKQMDDNTKKIQAMKEELKKGKAGYSSSADDVNLLTNAQIKARFEATNLAKETATTATMTGSTWRAVASEAVGGIDKYKLALQDAAAKTANMKGSFNYEESLGKLNTSLLAGAISLAAYTKAAKQLKIQDLTEDFKKGKMEKDKFDKEVNEVKFGKAQSALKQFKGELSELNKEWEYAVKGGDISGYSQALEQLQFNKINNELKTGKISFVQWNKEYKDLSILQYNREVATGAKNLKDYRSGVQSFQLKELNQEFQSGKMDIYAYNKAVTESQDKFQPGSAFFTGVNNYINQAGTLSQNVANVITNTFGTLENYFIDFTKTGKFAFKDFAKAVIEDINKIIIRALIIRPIAQGILSAIPTGGAGGAKSMEEQNGLGASNEALSRRGSYFDGKASFFANGGVVSGATPFSYGGGGKLGVLGEKGPEAIMPLRRDASGDLGIKAMPSNVIVNITNQSGGEVQQTEKQGPNGERILDILITTKVKEAFANGSMDKQMSQNYGLRRKGI